MKILKGSAAMVLGLFLVVPGRPSHAEAPAATQWIVATGQGKGARSERYWPSLSLFNSSSLDATVELAFLPQSPLDSSGRAMGDNSTASSSTVLVPAGKKLDLTSIWNPFGDGSLAGAVRVTTTGRDPQGHPLPVSAFSLTTVWKGDPLQETLGPLIPAQGPDALVGPGGSARVPFLQTGWSEQAWYRSNLFLLSTNAGSDTVVTVTLIDMFGESRGSRDLTLGRLSQTQVNDVAAFFNYQICAHGCPSDQVMTEVFDVFVTVRSGGPVAAGGVVIENNTGASLYVPSVRSAAP